VTYRGIPMPPIGAAPRSRSRGLINPPTPTWGEGFWGGSRNQLFRRRPRDAPVRVTVLPGFFQGRVVGTGVSVWSGLVWAWVRGEVVRVTDCGNPPGLFYFFRSGRRTGNGTNRLTLHSPRYGHSVHHAINCLPSTLTAWRASIWKSGRYFRLIAVAALTIPVHLTRSN